MTEDGKPVLSRPQDRLSAPLRRPRRSEHMNLFLGERTTPRFRHPIVHLQLHSPHFTLRYFSTEDRYLSCNSSSLSNSASSS